VARSVQNKRVPRRSAVVNRAAKRRPSLFEMCSSKSDSRVVGLDGRPGAEVKVNNSPSGSRVVRCLTTEWCADSLPAKSRALDSRVASPMKADRGNDRDKSGRAMGRAQREVRTCSVCGAKFSAEKESDFCPVCMLRGVLIDESQPTESLNPASEKIGSSSGDKPALLPRRFQNYELIRGENGKPLELGRGAMGVTYKAIDTNLRRFAALKVISPRRIRNEWIRERFVREARAAASLRHEHIASVYHLGFTGSRCFYAMEYVEGQTLEQILHLRGAGLKQSDLHSSRHRCLYG
jgi:Protein kinase domain